MCDGYLELSGTIHNLRLIDIASRLLKYTGCIFLGGYWYA